MENQLKTIKLTEHNSMIKIIKSLKEYGFAVITEHGISQNKIKQNFQSWEEFFNSEDKFNYLYDGKTYGGYFSEKLVEIPIGNEKRDFKEFGHFYHPNYPSIIENTHFELFNEVSEVFYNILNQLQEELPENITNSLPTNLVDMIKGSYKNCLRVNHYPPSQNNGRVRAGAHTDISFMTLLMTDQQSGLEVLTKDNQWIPIPTEYNSIVINIGDQMQEVTKGYFKSTYHRVINPKKEVNISRYSMPFFAHIHNHIKINETQTTEEFLIEKSKQSGFSHSNE